MPRSKNVCRDKANHVKEQCQKIEDKAITNSTKDLYQSAKNNREISTVGGRWREYCSKLYNRNKKIILKAVSFQSNGNEPPSLCDEVKEA